MPYFMLKDRKPLYPLSPSVTSCSSSSSDESTKNSDNETHEDKESSPETNMQDVTKIQHGNEIENTVEPMCDEKVVKVRSTDVKKKSAKRPVKQVKSACKKTAVKRKRAAKKMGNYAESSDDEWLPPALKGITQYIIHPLGKPSLKGTNLLVKFIIEGWVLFRSHQETSMNVFVCPRERHGGEEEEPI